MKILVTGSNGCIGKNLITYLRLNSNFNISTFNKNKSLINLSESIKHSDVIIHLAGSNREKIIKNFENNNQKLTKFICKNMKKNQKIFFSSTTLNSKKSPYVESKKECEKILKNYQKKIKFKLCIMKLNNIFGKDCKPYYNSVIATFCHSLPRNLPVTVNTSNKRIKFTYVEDLNLEILKLLNQKKTPKKYFIQKYYNFSVKQIYNYIKSFEVTRNKLFSDSLSRGFLKKLYSVYLTYVPKKKLKNKLIIHKDKRGKFIELLKNNSNGQISFLTVNPKKERGNHFHITKVERFYPLKGKGKIVFKKIDENKINVINFNANYPEVIETIPGTAHKIVNTSSNEIFMLIWSNEIYSPKKPDTHKYKI